MPSRIACFILTCLLSTLSLAGQFPNHISRVVYVTLDGVRWQDFFNHDRFPIFWKKYAKHAAIYGRPNSKKTMEVASIPVSLPSYRSQMAGAVQPEPCSDNECGPISVVTFPEELVKQSGFNKRDIVSISSWELSDNATESVAGTIFSNNGTRPMYDPDTGVADPIMADLNQQQAAHYPGDDTRPDKYTFAQALHYLEKYQPHFMWILLGDADDYAHDGNLKSYQQTLTDNDRALDQLMTTLKKLHLARETMIIVTTDHGRGNGENWTEHGEEYPESKQTWAFVLNGNLIPASREGDIYHYSTLSIRPTVEAVLAN